MELRSRVLVVDGDSDFSAGVLGGPAARRLSGRAGAHGRRRVAGGGSAASRARGHRDPPTRDIRVIEIARELRERHGEGLAIIFVSAARTDETDKVAGLLLGADDYLPKPVRFDHLIARVRRLVARLGVGRRARRIAPDPTRAGDTRPPRGRARTTGNRRPALHYAQDGRETHRAHPEQAGRTQPRTGHRASPTRRPQRRPGRGRANPPQLARQPPRRIRLVSRPEGVGDRCGHRRSPADSEACAGRADRGPGVRRRAVDSFLALASIAEQKRGRYRPFPRIRAAPQQPSRCRRAFRFRLVAALSAAFELGSRKTTLGGRWRLLLCGSRHPAQ